MPASPGNAGFIHLHVHSEYSFLSGVATVDALVERAAALGMPALALTDTDRMSGLIAFHLKCKARGIKPILGAEITLPLDRHERCVVLARNAAGYAQLCSLITRRQLNEAAFSFADAFAAPYPDCYLLCPHPKVLAELAAGPNRDRLYGELLNHDARSRAQSRDIEYRCRELGLPLVAANDVHFPERADWETHKLLRAVGLNASLASLGEEDLAPRNAHFRAGAEMRALFPGHLEAVANAARIAADCDAEPPMGRWILPEVAVPDGLSPAEYLRRQAFAGLHRNYAGRRVYALAREVQARELDTIESLGYASYFLMVKQVREWASGRFAPKHAGYRKPGDATLLRGSAANCLTLYNLGAGDLDPIACGLYFERFLHQERQSPPDVDLDFGWDEREEAYRYFVATWGEERVAALGTINHIQDDAAFREAAKALGYAEEEVNGLKRPGALDPDEAARIRALAGKLLGKPRFMGQHPGGIIVTNRPIAEHVACEYSRGSGDGEAGGARIITQIDMHLGLDALGLVKFDILGNGSISVLRDTLDQLRRQGIPDPGVGDAETLRSDPLVREMIAKGRTVGVFYIESPAQMRLNKQAKVEEFREMGIATSAIRPAGAPFTKLFVARQRRMKLGLAPDWDFLHPSLAKVLWETHDCLIFQEDVIKVCHAVAGLPLARADRVRKMMNSQHEGEPLDYAEVRAEFIAGCVAKSGLSADQARELWGRVASFRGFSFCKSHSLSYAALSYKCAYLKLYHPAPFLAAVISNNHGYYTRRVYLNEARRFGARVGPLDVNRAGVTFEGRAGELVPGLVHLRGLGAGAKAALVREREEGGPFRDFEDLAARSGQGRAALENLVRAGACGGFGMTQPEMLAFLDLEYLRLARAGRPEALGAALPGLPARGRPPAFAEFNLAQRCFTEQALLGYMLSGNVLDILDLQPAFQGAVPLGALGERVGKRVKILGWRVTDRVHAVQATGEPMYFLTLEDRTGRADIIFWPRAYARFRRILEAEEAPFEVWGRVEEDHDALNLIAERAAVAPWHPQALDFERASARLAQSYPESYRYTDITLPGAIPRTGT